MKPYDLDIWDILLIRHCKKNKRNFNTLKRIWARRCALNFEDVEKQFIAFHLLDLICEYKLISPIDLVLRLNPNQQMFQHNMDTSIKEYEYWNNTLNVCCSVLRLAEISRLPGYKAPTRFTRNDKK